MAWSVTGTASEIPVCLLGPARRLCQGASMGFLLLPCQRPCPVAAAAPQDMNQLTKHDVRHLDAPPMLLQLQTWATGRALP